MRDQDGKGKEKQGEKKEKQCREKEREFVPVNKHASTSFYSHIY